MAPFEDGSTDFDCSHSLWDTDCGSWNNSNNLHPNSDQSSAKERLDLYLLFCLMFIFAAGLTLTILYHCFKLCDCLRYLRNQPMYRSGALIPPTSTCTHPVIRTSSLSTSVSGQRSSQRITIEPVASSSGNSRGWSFGGQVQSNCSCVSVNVSQLPLRLYPDNGHVDQTQLPEYTEFDPGIIDLDPNQDPPPSYAEAVQSTKYEVSI